MQFFIPELNQKPPDILYHYTTPRGLLGIVESRKLWATHIRFLSDTSEYSYGREVIKERLEQHGKKFRNAHPTLVEKLEHEKEHWWTKHFVVSSLSEKGDLLSQWRGYGDSGRGFSIGFCGSTLQVLTERHHFWLIKCIYDEQEQREIVDQYLSRFSDLCSREDYLSLAHFLHSLLPPVFKHPSFSEEKEWRLFGVIQKPDSIKFRPGKSNMIPYIEFEFEPDGQMSPIREVVAGPSPDPASAKISLELLAKKYCPEAHVKISQIPFRCW